MRASADGQPERLWDISARLLGDGNRYVAIYDLNQGRRQPDGGQLTDSATLHAGWLLLLPWDAAGDGVVYGALPTSPPAAPPPSPHAGAVSGAQVRAGVELALDGGASVIMVAAAIDLADPDVEAAVQAAASRDAVVVVAAPLRQATQRPAAPAMAMPQIDMYAAGGKFDGVLRVGAITVDDRLGAVYQPGTVDVLAPGVGVASLGLGGRGEVVGSGTDFAVPFAAGLVALLRSAQPEMSATAVVEQIRRTSDRQVSRPARSGVRLGRHRPGGGAGLRRPDAAGAAPPRTAPARPAGRAGWRWRSWLRSAWAGWSRACCSVRSGGAVHSRPIRS